LSDLHYTPLGDGIYCIETGLYRHGLAACYLIREGDRVAFVDTGTTHTVPRLLAILAELGLSAASVDYVIPTHVHLDHAGGSGELMRHCPNATLVTHPKGTPHLIEPSRLAAGATEVYGAEAFSRDFGTLVPVPAERVVAAEDGHVVDLAGRPLVFVDTPGHANHHGCVWDERSRGFFTGDTFGISYREFDTAAGPFLFAPTTPVAFDPEAWLQSLDKLMAHAPRAMYLTHYCQVERPERLVGDLRHSIRALADLALAHEGAPAADREARLRAAIGDLLAADVRAHGCGLDETRVRKLLEVDTTLNAQGLEVWLRRRARRSAAPA
jgi:glyoxylase-like metal-dependent hydrolase (beta-lactamase superfamily II)